MDAIRPVSTRSRNAGIGGRRQALLQLHADLGDQAEAESARPAPDVLRIRHIKKRKLLIKDEIAGIDRLLAAIGLPETESDRAADGWSGDHTDPGGRAPAAGAAVSGT